MNTFSVVMHGWLPYAAGCIISHCMRDKYISENFEFLDPGYEVNKDYYKKLQTADIVTFTNYVWNQAENDMLAQWYKQHNPNGIVCYGGANIPEEEPFFSEYKKQRPYVDHIFLGAGEETFAHFLKTGTINNTIDRRHQKKISLPTPYSDGIFNRYIKENTNLVAAFETNRGCPYACSFCDWGGTARSKINRFDLDQIKKELDYIFSCENIIRIEIVDANFGIFERDLEIIEYMVILQQSRKTKMMLNFSGFAKNGSKWLSKIVELVGVHFSGQHGMSSLKISFQSHDKEVLRINQRGNLPNEKLFPLMNEYKAKGVNIDAEMIIGLPGETEQTFLNSLEVNRRLNIWQQRTYLLWALPNTPLYSKDFKEKYGIKTKKMFIPFDLDNLNTQIYHESRLKGKEIYTECDFKDPMQYQIFETVYECFSYDAKELQKIYDVYFWFNTLYNSHVARKQMINSPLTLHKQYEIYQQTHMPFIKGLQQNYRQIVYDTVCVPQPFTKVTKLSRAVWLTKFLMRSSELYEIYHNRSVALKELKQIYPNLEFNWIPISENKLKTLYFKVAKVDHAT